MVWNYQNAECSLIKNTVSFIIIFGTLSFAVTYAVPRRAARKIGGRYRRVLPASPTPPQPSRAEEAVKCFAGCGRRRCSMAGLRVVGESSPSPTAAERVRDGAAGVCRLLRWTSDGGLHTSTRVNAGGVRCIVGAAVETKRRPLTLTRGVRLPSRFNSAGCWTTSRPLRRTLIRFVLTGCDTAVHMRSGGVRCG